MEIKFILPLILLLIIGIFISVKNKISLMKIFILSLFPTIIFYQLYFLYSVKDINDFTTWDPDGIILALIAYTYAVVFYPSISSSIMVLYLKQKYPMKMFKLFAITLLIILFNMLFYIFYIKLVYFPFFVLPLKYVYFLIVTSLVTGTLSVAIFHYLTAIFHYLTEHKEENDD